MHRLSIAGAVVIMLAGCAQNTQSTGGTSAPVAGQAPAPVAISQSRLATISKAILTGLESTAAAYVLSGGVTPAEQTIIAKAEVLAEDRVNLLVEATPAALPADLINAANAIDEFVLVIPPGRVPASVTAGISALTVLIDTVTPLMNRSPTFQAAPAAPGKIEAAPAVRIVA